MAFYIGSMKVFLRFLGQITAAMVTLAIFLGFLGKFHPALDTFAHFRLHLSVGLLVGVLFLLIFGALRSAMLAALVGVVGLYSTLDGTSWSAREMQPNATLPIYKLFHLNLLWNNERKDDVINKILELDPEFVAVMEQSRKWRERFVELETRWPHFYQCRKTGQVNATAVYSKWPIVDGSKFCGTYAALVRVDVVAPDGKPITFAANHIRWPWPASGPKQLNTLLPDIKTFSKDAIISGDFNATTWSWAVEKYADAAGASIVSGIGPTWMASLPIIKSWFWAGLPIDNVMEKGAVKVTSAKTLESLGADHLPILVEFQIDR